MGWLPGTASFTFRRKISRRCSGILAGSRRRGAALMFTSGTAHGEAIGSFAGGPLYHASLDAEEYRALLARNGFILLRHVGNDPACGGATIWLARREG